MKISVKWLNRYLQPPEGETDFSPQQVEDFLTGASFPIEAREDLPGGDAMLDVEVTSNRGDCLSHLGLARELAARTGRKLLAPAISQNLPRAGNIDQSLSLDNTLPDLCPRFTVQLIRGVKIGPSPAWLVEALEAVGQRSINNIVDVTNFITLELGHPCHAFDLSKLSPPPPNGPALIIRLAHKGEPLTTLDGRKRTLAGDEVVVADTQRAQSLAGIIGGGDSEVTQSTTDIVLEVATWDPVAVRRAARRHQVRTDAGHRFERYVDPRTLDYPAARAAALMIEIAGGQLEEGMLDQGQPPRPHTIVELRPARCRALLGIDISDEAMLERLAALEIQTELRSGSIGQLIFRCTIPPFRPDIQREVDLIEEVARMHGFENIPIHPRISVQVKHPQESELAVRELARILTGVGFYETVTFSFISRQHAQAFLPAGLDLIAVDDERRKHEPALRPSIIPGLLTVRRANQHAGVDAPGEGGIRLFELANTFASANPASNPQPSAPSTSPVPGIREQRTLALLMDVPNVGKGKPGTVEHHQHAIRILRGALESLSQALTGVPIELTPIKLTHAAPPTPAFEPAACAIITLRGQQIGTLGLIAPATQKLFDLDIPVIAAELALDPLVASFPPRSRIHLLPAYPGIERDLSLIVDETVSWQQLRQLVEAANLERLDEVAFVGSYRGKQIGPGKKSLTLRLRFRDPARTLRHEEVDPQIAAITELASRELSAALRA